MKEIYVGITLFAWMISLLFSKEYYAHREHKGRYYGCLLFPLLATVGVFLSSNLMLTFVCFEIMSISSYLWVIQEETKEALQAGITYLAVAVIGGMVMLMGVFLLYDATGTLVIDQLQSAVRSVWDTKSGQLYAAGFCMLFGFGAKAGMFPLHFCLPKAYEEAPAPASALLSAILTKCGMFGVVILTVELFVNDTVWGMALLVAGLLTMVTGAVLAVFSLNLKRILAYSSVSQLGFIFVGLAFVCLLGEHNGLAWRGSFLHMVNHTLIKLLFFNCAGVIFMNLHTLQLNEIRGYGRKKPFLAGCFLMGVLGIGGFPLWNGYVSKTLLHESIVEYIALVGETGGNTFVFSCVEWLFLITGGLTVAYMLKVFLCIFVEKHPEKQEEYDARTKDMSLLTKIAMGLVVVILPILGMFPKKIMQPMADLAGDFFHGGHLAHEIQYFSWVNIKGSLISIGIGLIVYVGIIRPFLLEKEKWPEYLSLERFFTAGLQGCMTLVGGICKGIDVLPDKIAALFWSQPAVSLRTIFKKMDILPESGLLYLGKSIFAETTEPEENVLTKSLHKKLDKKVEIARIIGSSFSFGLLLACVGLLLTILYLLMS